MKCQGWLILLRYKRCSLYPSILQHVIKPQGIKITLLKALIHYKHVCYNHVLLYRYLKLKTGLMGNSLTTHSL